MSLATQEITAEVIRCASREKSADAALREVLRKYRGLLPFDAAEVSRAVFTYYRWHGWTRAERGVDAKMRLARRLAERFRANPASIPIAELQAKAVPEWTTAQVEVSDQWLRALQSEPKLWLRAKRGRGKELAEKLGFARVVALPDAVVYEGEADLFGSPEFHAGEFEIQDITSQFVGLICNPKPGETWWDACAGEGGKLLHLSDLMQNKGLIWASDRAEWRLIRLKRRAARAKAFNYRSVVWDGGTKRPTKVKFDGVLVDGPCSGLGTWQRNPQARWTTTEQDVQELADVQRELLNNVAAAVKPGGKLIYSVCTLTREETGEVVEAFNRVHPEFQPMAVSLFGSGEGKARDFPGSTRLTIWPHDFGGNGMFVAAWRRNA